MQSLSRPGASIVVLVCIVAASIGFGNGAAANPLPTVPAPGGGECAVMKDLPYLRGLWLGHFSGGRLLHKPGLHRLEWRDQYSCFPSRAACSRWLRHLRHHYRQVTGYTTCLPLR